MRKSFLLVPILAISFLVNCNKVKEYTITWNNDDGTTLSTTKVKENEIPKYDKETPKKAPTAEATYTFSGWSPDIVKATRNAIYTATYAKKIQEYEITFMPGEGTWMDGTTAPIKQNFPYGVTPMCDEVPVKSSSDQFDYVFSHWSPELTPVSGPKTYVANFMEFKRNTISLVVDMPYSKDKKEMTIFFACVGHKTMNTDWGDGTHDSKNQHTYTKAGHYVINVGFDKIMTFRVSTDLGLDEKGNKYIKVVKLMEGVSEIEDYAFAKCSSLISVWIPKSVLKIEEHAFSECNELKSVLIPKNVKEIGALPFYDCPSLTSIVIDKENAFYSSKDKCNVIIENKSKKLVQGISNSKIPSDVVSIADSAFYNCSFSSATLPDTLTSIGESSFRNCKSLTSIFIPKNVSFIGSGAFRGCSALNSIVIDSENKTYNSRENCNSIIETATNKLLMGSNNSTIPNGVIEIASLAFNGCIALTSIAIPSSVNIISTDSFRGCSALTSIVVDKENKTFNSGENANAIIMTSQNKLFIGCRSTIIPSSVTCIGFCAFHSCSRLSSIKIPSSVIEIDTYAFYNCFSLSAIFIPSSVVEMGWQVFDNCFKLSQIHCQAKEQPDSWDSNWKGNCPAKPLWGCDPEINLF